MASHGIQSAWSSWSAWSHLEPTHLAPLSCQGGCGGWICWDQRGQSDSSDSYGGFRRFGRREMLWIGERPGNDSHPDALSKFIKDNSKILVSACRVNTATGKALDELMCKRHALFRNIRQSKKSSLFQFFVDSYLIKLTCEMSNVLNWSQLSNVKSEFGVDPIRCCSDVVPSCSNFCSPRGVKNFCSGCGAPRGSGPFCSQCGQRLETA